MTFAAASGAVRLVLGPALREYRGTVRATLVGSDVRTVVASSLEAYLRSVVPAEMPPSWASHALRAQAVAARSYATWERDNLAHGWYDTCDTTACQVFKGAAEYTTAGTLTVRYEHPNTDAAVSATAGRVLTFGGAIAFAQFSAANGGWTVAGPVPYLQAFPDPYDGVVPSTAHRWTATVDRATCKPPIRRSGSCGA